MTTVFYASFPIVEGDAAVGFARILKSQMEAHKVHLNSTEWVQSAQTSVKNVEFTTKSCSFSIIPRRFKSKSLVHDLQLGKHCKGDDYEGLQLVICMFRIDFVKQLNNNCKATFRVSQNLDLAWTRGLANFLQRTQELDVKSNVWSSSMRNMA